jgi:preprotein translocase subunit YajC
MIQYTLLQAPAQGAGGNMMVMLLIMAVMFFFMVWPQMRRQKKAKSFQESLQKGDKVVTSGGVHGKIASVTDTQYILEIEEGKMKIEKTGISMEMTQAAYPAPKA